MMVAGTSWWKSLWFSKYICNSSQELLNGCWYGALLIFLGVDSTHLHDLGSHALLAQCLTLNVDHEACRRGGVMALESDGACSYLELNLLGSPVNRHRTVGLEPVHAKDRVISAEGQNLHICGELTALCVPAALAYHRRTKQFTHVCQLDLACYW